MSRAVIYDMRLLEFFSGMGGMRYGVVYGLELLRYMGLRADGVRIDITSYDINHLANCILEYNARIYKEYEVYDKVVGNVDILNLDDDHFNRVDRYDIWTLSPPCQPYSRRNISEVQSLDENIKDFRRLPILKVIKFIMNTDSHQLPTHIILENIKEFYHSHDFKLFTNSLATRRYKFKSFVLSSLQFGFPNERTRLYLVAKLRHSFPTYFDDDLDKKQGGGGSSHPTDSLHLTGDTSEEPVLSQESYNLRDGTSGERGVMAIQGNVDAEVLMRLPIGFYVKYGISTDCMAPLLDFIDLGEDQLNSAYTLPHPILNKGAFSLDIIHKHKLLANKRTVSGQCKDATSSSSSCSFCLNEVAGLEMCTKSKGLVQEGGGGVTVQSKILPYTVGFRLLNSDSERVSNCVRDYTLCFTKNYHRYVKGTGSVWCFSLDDEGCIGDAIKGGCIVAGGTNSSVPLPIRYFTPREIARMMGYVFGGERRLFIPMMLDGLDLMPIEFPDFMSCKQLYSLLGNSLNPQIITMLLLATGVLEDLIY